LKEYRGHAGQNITVYVGGEHPNEISYTMNEGVFAGEDPRLVAMQAIEWLEGYLGIVDELCKERRTGAGQSG
jgi:hypothetical protein